MSGSSICFLFLSPLFSLSVKQKKARTRRQGQEEGQARQGPDRWGGTGESEKEGTGGGRRVWRQTGGGIPCHVLNPRKLCSMSGPSGRKRTLPRLPHHHPLLPHPTPYLHFPFPYHPIMPFPFPSPTTPPFSFSPSLMSSQKQGRLSLGTEQFEQVWVGVFGFGSLVDLLFLSASSNFLVVFVFGDVGGWVVGWVCCLHFCIEPPPGPLYL